MSELDEIRIALWNSPAEDGRYPDTAYQRDVLEQYKLCLEMADRISQRRGFTNTFFLTFNTAGAGALAAVYDKIDAAQAVPIFLVGIVLCVAWGLLLRSYRTLNTAKFKVIGVLEERLPASPIWSAEWKALGEGKDWRKHVPLGPLETIVPIGFGTLYAVLALFKISGG